MKFKIKELLAARQSLEKFIKIEHKDIKVSYAISKNANALKRELAEYDEKQGELLRKYGTSETGINFEFKRPGSFSSYMDDLKQIQDIEIEINPFQIKLSLLDGYGLSGADIDNIKQFLIIDIEEPKPLEQTDKK